MTISTINILGSEYQFLVEQANLIPKLEKQIEDLLITNKELSNQIATLKEKILDLQQKLFGKKKDRIEQNKPKTRKKTDKQDEKSKRGRKPIDKSNIDVTNHYDFATPPFCPCCSNGMVNIGSNDSYHEDYKIIIKKVKISQAKYVCRDCNIIKVANGSRLPIRKGTPMPAFLAQVVLDKFSNGLPCYRQAQNYGYAAHNYTRQMFNNWIMQAADLVVPILDVMLLKMLQSKYLAADETGLVILNLEGKNSGGKGYMCVLKQAGEKFNFVYCWVIRSRKQDVINGKLKDFKGYLQTDGLNFYFKLKDILGIKLVNCWAHARRKFIAVIKLSNKDEGVAFNIVEKIDALYRIERNAKQHNLSANKIFKLRQEGSVAILTELKAYLESTIKTTPPKSKLGIAIKYVLDRWEALTEYTKNPQLDIDNNHTERCIKFIVIGRKNWLFGYDIDSANKLGVLYSLVISCKINNVNPRTYLEYIFTQMPYINKSDPQELEQLLPDRFDVNKRFDQEYRQKKEIIETVIDHNEIDLKQKIVAA